MGELPGQRIIPPMVYLIVSRATTSAGGNWPMIAYVHWRRMNVGRTVSLVSRNLPKSES